MTVKVNNFMKYTRISGDFEVTRDMLETPKLSSRNPFDFLTEFDAWFEWAKLVHFHKADPVLLNIEVFRLRAMRQMEVDWFSKGANLRGIMAFHNWTKRKEAANE